MQNDENLQFNDYELYNGSNWTPFLSEVIDAPLVTEVFSSSNGWQGSVTVGGNLTMDRSMYPDGTGRWSHLGNWQDWPVVYWVPEGSTFASPNGETVIRNRQFNGNSIGGDRIARVICPEVFENTVGGTNFINMRGAVIQGHHLKNTQWLGRSGVTVHRTYAEATNGTNGLSLRPGKWFYSGDRADPNNEHRQGVYAQGWYPTAPNELNFQAWEGTYLEGDWIPEGFNWNRASGGDFVVVLNGFLQDRVWVLYRGASSKEPGGDALQVFVGPQELHVIDFTLNKTSLQGIFLQNNQSSVTPRVMDFRRVNIRSELDYNTYGGSAGLSSPGFQFWPNWDRGAYGETWNIEDVHVWHPDYPRNQLIHRESQFTDVTLSDVPNFVSSSDVGVNYSQNL